MSDNTASSVVSLRGANSDDCSFARSQSTPILVELEAALLRAVYVEPLIPLDLPEGSLKPHRQYCACGGRYLR
jgi:hypothetical protein